MGLNHKIGDAPELKIYDFLAEMFPFDYTLTQIAQATKVSRNTIIKYLRIMADSGVVVITRKIGTSELYALSDTKFNRIIKTAMIEGVNNESTAKMES